MNREKCLPSDFSQRKASVAKRKVKRLAAQF